MNEREQLAAREYQMVSLLGAPHSGKSSLTEELIEDWIRERKGRGEVRILDPTGRNWEHYGGEWPNDGPDDYRSPEARATAWLQAFRRERFAGGDLPAPALVVLEDADVYLGGGQPRGIWRDFIATFRHWRCDVIFIARRTQDLPKLVFTSSRYVYLFQHREAYAKDYLRRFVGASAVRQIPQEPFSYVLVDVDTGEIETGKTKKRAAMAADLA